MFPPVLISTITFKKSTPVLFGLILVMHLIILKLAIQKLAMPSIRYEKAPDVERMLYSVMEKY
ncbi:MAG: hypothetical protein ACPL0A_02630, partial [Candidatus Micrarchaeia archaeon]